MEVGERYIIEISDVIATNNGKIAKIKGFNALVFDENGLNKLEKICNGTQMLTPFDIGNIKKVHHDIGYSEGFADGEKYQANKMASETEPHEPKEGDVYLDCLGQAFVTFNVGNTKCKYMYDDGSSGEMKIEELKTSKPVGNIKADLEALQRVVGSYE